MDYELREVRELPAEPDVRSLEDIVRLAFTLIATYIFPAPAWLLTAFNCGTSIDMMNRHYRDTIDDENTVPEFWRLTPKRLLARKPKIEMPSTKRVQWQTRKR